MINYVREAMYEVYKNGELQQTRVGFLYSENSNVAEKVARLYADYPASEGYELKLAYDRKL